MMAITSAVSSITTLPLTEENIQQRFPLHYLVWKNDPKQLKQYIELHSNDVDIEQKDHRQRTPLMLATTLDHKECVRILLDHNALVNITDHSGFNVLHEAVTTVDPKLIRDVYLKKEQQRYLKTIDGIKNFLSRICDQTSDFYIEMKWEFTSWVPLISQLCPSDTFKIYKRGSKVRVDSTLIGMNDEISAPTAGAGSGPTVDVNWQRGNMSLIFAGSLQGGVLMEVDHTEKRVYKRTLEIIKPNEVFDFVEVTEDQIADRLTMPIRTTFIDTEKVQFERAKQGLIPGFRTDRIETFNGYECKVYSANNVEFVTKTRIEHLTQEDKNRCKSKDNASITMLSFRSIVGIHEQNIPNPFDNKPLEPEWTRNPYKLSMVDYFNLSNDDQRDIGAPREMKIRKKFFRANVWVADDYPLSFKEQILPIVDLLSTYSSHFAKLRDFINCKLPSGFPIKIEIPLFHLLNAMIKFGNVFALDQPVDGVHSNIPESSSNIRHCQCSIDERCFDPPNDYEVIGDGSEMSSFSSGYDEQDFMAGLDDLVVAQHIENLSKNQHSNGGVVSNNSSVNLCRPDQTKRSKETIEEKKHETLSNRSSVSSFSSSYYSFDDNKSEPDPLAIGKSTTNKTSQLVDDEEEDEQIIKLTMEQSKRDYEELVQRQQMEEQEIFQKVLKLSLIEK